MYLSSSILGRSTIRYVQERAASVLLQIGSDTFDREVLAGLHCFNFAAAANLTRVLTRELQVKDTKDLFNRVSPDRLVLPQLGAVSLAVLGAAFEAKGLGGKAPLESWFDRHKSAVVTFTALKHRKPSKSTKKSRKAVARKGSRSIPAEVQPHA